MSRIAQINNFFRKAVLTNQVTDGRCIVTQGVASLAADTQTAILDKVRDYDKFTPDHDPNAEHDFGVIEIAGVEKVYWKIDTYEDETLQWRAEDPENGYRVLTIMLASEN